MYIYTHITSLDCSDTQSDRKVNYHYVGGIHYILFWIFLGVTRRNFECVEDLPLCQVRITRRMEPIHLCGDDLASSASRKLNLLHSSDASLMMNVASLWRNESLDVVESLLLARRHICRRLGCFSRQAVREYSATWASKQGWDEASVAILGFRHPVGTSSTASI